MTEIEKLFFGGCFSVGCCAKMKEQLPFCREFSILRAEDRVIVEH